MLTREAVASEGIDGGFAAVYPILRAMEDAGPDPARLLRRRPRSRPVRAVRRARPTAGRARAGRPAERRRGPPARRGRSGQSRTAPPCPGRAAARPIAGRSSVPPARTSCSSTGSRRSTSNAAGRRSRRSRPRTIRPSRVAAARALGRARRRRPHPRARHPQGRRRGRRGIAVPRAAARRRVRRRLSRPGPARARGRGPECPRATRSSGPRPDCGRTSSAGRSARHGPTGPAPVPQVGRIVGHEITAVEALGKNLLIRFDNGLEIRTHLRMNGSWHRYRPGERWRRPPSRARLVIEVPGAVAVCFDAPVVELLEQRAEALHPSLGRARAGPARARLRRRRGDPPAARSGASRRSAIGEALARPAGAGRDRQRLQERGPVDRAGLAVRDGRRPRRRHARPARRDGPAAARRQRHARPRPRARHDGRRPRRPGPALRLRPDRPTVPPLPDADRQPPPGPRHPAHDLLVPGLPGRSGRERDRRPLRGRRRRLAVPGRRLGRARRVHVRRRRPGRRPVPARRSCRIPGSTTRSDSSARRSRSCSSASHGHRSWRASTSPVVERYFPEYPAEMRRRLSR